jgi:arylsulfatase A-like enzyme
MEMKAKRIAGQPARLAAIAAMCLALTCGNEQARLNLVLIGVDTLRHDHLGCYGYDRDTSPNIDELADKGVLFENVVSPCPWTLPSFASVFTSLYPTQHGATGTHTPMRTTFPTLASLLKDNGYATGAIINAPYLKQKFKLDRGFDFYDMPPREGRAADGTTEDALTWIDENRDLPFFIFIHYFDPHIPYSPPAPYDTLFDPDYSGTMKMDNLPKGLPRLRMRGFKEMEAATDADWNHIRSLYDGEIAFADEEIGNLLKGLDGRGLTENTLIVFLSDHGEEFFEHGGFEHGHSLFDELLKVPLIFSLPGGLPEHVRISRQVRLLDVEPTILELLDITTETSLEGVSLVQLLGGGRSLQAGKDCLLPSEIGYSEALLYGSQKKSLTAHPWKLIYDTKGGEMSVFNLEEDPGEHQDLSSEAGESLDLLQQTLFKTLFAISDTWYVEMGGGKEPHRFDLNISCEVIRGSGHYKLHKWIDKDGNILPADAFGTANIGPTRIEIQNLRIREPVTLAFKPPRERVPIRFDLHIDGKPAAERTFIGDLLTQPVMMPFVEPGSENDPSADARPGAPPDAPYFLVWLSETEYRGEINIRLDEETKQELRALGYIQ